MSTASKILNILKLNENLQDYFDDENTQAVENEDQFIKFVEKYKGWWS